MGELLRIGFIGIYRLFIGSGTNAAFAFFQFSSLDLNSINTWGHIGQMGLGIVGSIVAIVYGYYQIKLIRKKLKDAKK